MILFVRFSKTFLANRCGEEDEKYNGFEFFDDQYMKTVI